MFLGYFYFPKFLNGIVFIQGAHVTGFVTVGAVSTDPQKFTKVSLDTSYHLN